MLRTMGPVPYIDPDALLVGQETTPRLGLSAITLSSGSMRLCFFTARKDQTVTSFRILCSTAAGATPTLVRLALFSAAPNDDLTLIGSTPNDTSLLAAAQAYTKATSASAAVVRGSRYAWGALCVTAASVPQIVTGYLGAVSSEAAQAPRLSATFAATDIPSSISAASLTATSYRPYAVLL